MARSDGTSLGSRLSNRYLTSTVAETIFLVGLGVLAVTLHAYLRLPLRVPGHKGLIWISLLMVGRLVSQRRWAATLTSSGAAATSLIPMMGFKDPIDTVAFWISGIVLDLGFMFSPRLIISIWGIAILGAVAHATKPVAKYLTSIGTGFPFPSLLTGLAYPMALHGLFGAIGAIAAALFLKLPIKKPPADK